MWFVYIVQCADKSFYTGITNDINRRIKEHNASSGVGSKYTRIRRPVKLMYKEKLKTRSLATKRENEIKRLSHFAKKHLALSGKAKR